MTMRSTLATWLVATSVVSGLPTSAWAAPPTDDPPPQAPAVEQPPAPAPAQTLAGDDRVALNNGGMLRGQVIESIPESHVTILVAGEKRRVEWAEVLSVDIGHFSSERPSNERPASEHAVGTAPPEALTPAPGRPRIHMDVLGAKKPVELRLITSEGYISGYNVSGRSVTFETVCQSPCDEVIDASPGRAFIVGSDLWTFSRRLDLSNEGPEVTLEVVRPGNAAARISGAVLFGLGLGGLITGPLLLLVGGTQAAGAVVTGVSVPLFAIGLPLMVLGRAKARVRR